MRLLLFLGTALALVHSGHLVADFCRLPKDEGQGSANIFSVHYNPKTDMCHPFFYKGEGGNQNRFGHERDCIQKCSTKAESIYPVDPAKACHFPKAKGNCSLTLLRYYYDSVYDKCRRFHYSGCVGNGNRFTDMDVCNATCDGIHDDRLEEEDVEWDTPVAIICGVLLGLVVVGIVGTIVVLTVMSKKKEAKKKTRTQQDVPLQEVS